MNKPNTQPVAPAQGLKRTYKARLDGDRITWIGEAPSSPVADVEVIVSEPPGQGPPEEPNGKRAAEILERLSRRDPFKGIADPVQWQREMREERDVTPGTQG